MKKIRSIGTSHRRIRSIGTTRDSVKNIIDIANVLGADESNIKIKTGKNTLSMYTQRMYVYNKKFGGVA